MTVTLLAAAAGQRQFDPYRGQPQFGGPPVFRPEAQLGAGSFPRPAVSQRAGGGQFSGPPPHAGQFSGPPQFSGSAPSGAGQFSGPVPPHGGAQFSGSAPSGGGQGPKKGPVGGPAPLDAVQKATEEFNRYD